MKRFTLLLAFATFGLSFVASAYDDDPGYGDRRGYGDGRSWYGGREHDSPLFGASSQKPLYYRPTMRYYGNGYTVNYRYVPVYAFDFTNTTSSGAAANFRTEAFHIATDEIPSWGANSPRLTVKDARSAGPRTAVTTIIRKTSSGKKAGKAAPMDAAPAPTPEQLPTVTPTPAVAPAPAAAPAPDAAPAPPKP